jgi:hypothetical protein
VPRFARVAWLLTLAWSPDALAQSRSCPSGAEPWVEVIFSGPAWSDTVRDGVVRELRIELARRSLEVCPATEAAESGTPQKVVTLLAADSERVSIVASNLEQEGGFTGRTILVGPIPEDARALAIAQAVDEALRGEGNQTERAPPPAVPTRVVQPAARQATMPSWFVAAALAPALQVAPAAADRTRAVVAPGALFRLSIGRGSVGGSLGVAVTRASDMRFGSLAIRDFRLPADVSFDLRLARGPAQAIFDVGLVAALVNYEYVPTGDAHSTLELGGRAGARFGWGRRVVPWVGASLEVLSSSADLRFAPTGSFGRAPNVWVGFALGTEVRWP